MKKTIVFIGLSLLVMASCDYHSKHDEELLDKIEKLWVMSDSSAEDALRGAAMLDDELYGASEMVNMKYDLLNIRLRDKLYVVPSSDDSIKRVVGYYDKHGTTSDKARAYYYMLSVYRDLHDSPRAIVSGLKSLDFARSMSEKDSLLLMHIYSTLSEVYHNQLNTDDATRMALEYMNLYPNDPWAVMDVASAYQEEKDTERAMKYYVKAYDLMMRDSVMITHPSNYCELLGIFAMYKDEERSRSLYDCLCKLRKQERPSNYDVAMGYFHKEHNNVDSALYYFKHRYENADRWIGKRDAASQMMECYYKRGDFVKAADYAMKFRQANDSVTEERKFELTRNAQAEYRYNRDREEEAQIKLDALKMQRWLLIAIIVFMAITVFGYAVYVRRKKRLEDRIKKSDAHISLLSKEMAEKETSVKQIREELGQTNELLSTKRAELTEAMTAMAEKHKEMIELKENLSRRELAIEELKTQLVETDNQISKLQYELAGKSQMNKELIRELVSKDLTDLGTDVRKMFENSINCHVRLTEGQWEEVFANIDNKHPELKTALEERVPRLNVALLRTAYLMMEGLTNQQIETIMDVSRQTQWERAKKLEKYIGDFLPFRNH